MIGYWDLFPGLYYYRLVTRIISDTLTTNGFGHRFILLAWKYCLFSFLHFKSQILIRKVFILCFPERTRQYTTGFSGSFRFEHFESDDNDVCVETCRFDNRFDETYQPWGLFSEAHVTDCHITCPNPNRNSTFVNRSLIPNKLRYYLLF